MIEDIGQGFIARPLQRPHPPIVVTAVAPFSKGVTEAAVRGWDPISANFLMPAWVKSHWPKYVEGCERGGRAAEPANWRVAKSVFVAKDAATAKAYATDPDGPYANYYRSLFTKLKKNGRIELFKTRRDQPDDEVTLEMICDKLIIYGTPDSVADQLLAFQDEVGQFGTLLYAGKDWKDRELGRESMILMAEKVMPRINAANFEAKQRRGITAQESERRGPYRSHSLSGTHRPAETQAAGRQEARGVGHPQRRGMADRGRDAANRAEPADGTAAVAGCAELVVARIRHARRLLAAVQGADRPQYAGDAGVECQRMHLLSAGRFRGAGGRL